MNSLTPFGKAFLSTVLILLFAILVAVVWNGRMTPNCEALYNDYSSTVNQNDRDILFSEGINNGCFHYN